MPDLANVTMVMMPRQFRNACDKAINLLVSDMKDIYANLLDETDISKAVRFFQVFNIDRRPDNNNDLMPYGDELILCLVDIFETVLQRNGTNTGAVLGQWRMTKTLISTEFKDNIFAALWMLLLSKGTIYSDYFDILQLVQIMLGIPISSAQCERTIYAQNRIKCDVRSSLNTNTVETLIRLSDEGSTIDAFDPSDSVDHWFEADRKFGSFTHWPSDYSGSESD